MLYSVEYYRNISLTGHGFVFEATSVQSVVSFLFQSESLTAVVNKSANSSFIMITVCSININD